MSINTLWLFWRTGTVMAWRPFTCHLRLSLVLVDLLTLVSHTRVQTSTNQQRVLSNSWDVFETKNDTNHLDGPQHDHCRLEPLQPSHQTEFRNLADNFCTRYFETPTNKHDWWLLWKQKRTSWLKALGLHWLQRRRLRQDLTEPYKILTGKEKIKSDQLFQKARTTELRGHSLKQYKKCSRLELRKHSFSQRIVDHWNLDGQVWALKADCLTSPLIVTVTD